jgi:predicted DNA-binding protein
MSRPPFLTKPKNLLVRMPLDDYKDMSTHADRLGMTISEFVRRAIKMFIGAN